MQNIKRIFCVYACLLIFSGIFPLFPPSTCSKYKIDEDFLDQEIANKKTYAALFSSANGLLGPDVDMDRMEGLLKSLNVASIALDKTATAEDISKLTSQQARLADENNGNLFLYFSGHGVPHSVVLEDSKFSLIRWLRYVDGSVSGDIEVTIFLDTCYAGSVFDAATKGEFKHIKKIKIAASSTADTTSPDYGSVFGGAFTGSFYMAYETYRLRHSQENPKWGDVIDYVYNIYSVVTPTTVPLFGSIKVD